MSQGAQGGGKERKKRFLKDGGPNNRRGGRERKKGEGEGDIYLEKKEGRPGREKSVQDGGEKEPKTNCYAINKKNPQTEIRSRKKRG